MSDREDMLKLKDMYVIDDLESGEAAFYRFGPSRTTEEEWERLFCGEWPSLTRFYPEQMSDLPDEFTKPAA